MTDETSGLPQLLNRTTDLLRSQRDALIGRDIARTGRVSEALAELFAVLQAQRAYPIAPTADDSLVEALRQIREQVRLNRRLTENGLAVADHFAASLALSTNTTSVLLHERA